MPGHCLLHAPPVLPVPQGWDINDTLNFLEVTRRTTDHPNRVPDPTIKDAVSITYVLRSEDCW